MIRYLQVCLQSKAARLSGYMACLSEEASLCLPAWAFAHERRIHITGCLERVRSALQIIVDLSRASSIGDMRPNRLAVMAGVLQGFIRKFFDENPLSHLGLVIMRNGVAERLTELAGSPVSSVKFLMRHLAGQHPQSVGCWSPVCAAKWHTNKFEPGQG